MMVRVASMRAGVLAATSIALVWYWAAPAGAQAPPVENPTGAISLRDAVGLALSQSPDLAAFDAGRRVADARAVQAGRWPNPVMTTFVEDLAGSNGLSDVVQPQATVQLGQLVELGGKRAARQRLAGLDRDLASWDYEAARLDVLTRVSESFLGVLAAQQSVTHTVRARDVARQVREAVAARVQAGVVSPIEETRADVLLANAEIDVERARRTLDARRRQLATEWGSPTALFISATGDLEALAAIPTREALEASLKRNPDLARWTAEVDRRRAALVVARSARVPDVTVSAGYRRFTTLDSNAVVIGVSLPLPWFDRNRDGIRAAEASVDRAQAEARAAELSLVAMLADAYRALASAADEVTTLRTRVVPAARSVFDAVEEGYRLGRFSLMDVLDAQRTFTESNGRYLQALTAYHQAAATVERLVGQPLTDVATSIN
jgi:cobalt-zinc-cadmium efflux system outer membrane protein